MYLLCKYSSRSLLKVGRLFSPGMKTLVWSITHFNATQLPQMNNGPVPVKGMREEEVSPVLGELWNFYCTM